MSLRDLSSRRYAQQRGSFWRNVIAAVGSRWKHCVWFGLPWPEILRSTASETNVLPLDQLVGVIEIYSIDNYITA